MQTTEELAPQVGIAPICQALGVSRAGLYRRRRPRRESQRKTPARALTETERQQVLQVLHAKPFVDKAPAQVYATLLDKDTYLCSTRTMYRILDAQGEVRERREQLHRPNYKKPELLAVAPNQVWSWDITKLLGPVKWSYFYLYVILDIFSRYVVGWTVAEGESAALAKRLIAETCEKQGILPGQLLLHADRGSAMTAKPVVFLLAELGVTRSHSRPHVSDDNPYSEAQFKTLKYRPDFPDRFGCIEDAITFCRSFFPWYNSEHRHSGIGLLTPETVHYGQATKVIAARQETLSAAYAAHPERFVRRPPQPLSLPSAAWINPPVEKATRQDALGSTQTTPDDLRVHPVCITYGPPAQLPASLNLAARVELTEGVTH
jgi:putative transposase